MALLRRLFSDFVFGNFFIALCSVSMVFTTFLLNGLPIKITPFTVFLFAATYLLYNFHRHSFGMDYSGRSAFRASLKNIHLRPFEKIMYVIASAILIMSIFYLNARVFPYLLPLAIVAIAYSAPLIKRNNKKIRLLEVYLIKTPVLALVWALVTTLIPLEEQNIGISSSFIFLQFLSRTLFIFALCIPFEIRDMEVDKKNNVLTLAVICGRKNTKMIGGFTIIAELISHHFMDGISFHSVVSLHLSSLLALMWIIFQNKNRGPYYYKFLVDGTMIVRFVFLYFAMYIK